MKVRAYTRPRDRTPENLVTAWQIYHKRIENPKEYKGRTYYSTHSNQNDVKEMIHYKGRGRKINPFFQFKNNDDREPGEGESITHQFIKGIISELKVLNFVIGEEQITINVDKAFVEYRFKTDEGDFIADIFVEFSECYPQKYFDKWLGILAIEIHFGHKVDKEKREALRKHGIPIIEVKVLKKV